MPLLNGSDNSENTSQGLKEMCNFGQITGPGEPLPPPHLLLHFEALEECILSEQVSFAEVQGLLREEPDFARWLRTKVSGRGRGCVSPAM